MILVTLIGSGNVAHHLINTFVSNKNIEIVQVFARRPETVNMLVPKEKIISDFKDLRPSDLYILSVSDDSISEISRKLPFSNQLVVHTSGTKPMTVLSDQNRKGVFYPLQTFSKNKDLDFRKVPICLETSDPTDFSLLETLAKSISDQVFAIDSEKRKALHVSAVFVSNFVNCLYRMGAEICEEHHISFEILKPLIAEVADKINYLSPQQAQTGPALRNDIQTLETHMDFLRNDPEKKAIYQLLSQAIRKASNP